MTTTVSLWPAVVAVLGTLAGGLLTSWIQRRTARAGQDESRRQTAVTALATLAEALANHRRAMWELGEQQLAGADTASVKAARDDTHTTRSALTAPLVTVQILTPQLATAATAAAQATYAMRNPATADALAQGRLAALKACDHLVDQAAALFARLGTAAR